jgi:hypothetical protein
MSNWWITRTALKDASGTNTSQLRIQQLDRVIEAASRKVERLLHRFFIPRTQTRLFRWPSRQVGESYILWLDQDLLAITTLQTKAQDTSPTTISSSDYFLEPNLGPNYRRIEIDQSSTAAFEAGSTGQRAISVAGRWGFSEDTESSGTVASGLAADAAATTAVVSDSSLLGVGDTLLIESEQVFVKGVSSAALDSILLNDAAVTKDKGDNSITVDGSHGIVAGEVLLIESERMFVEEVSTNLLTVIRGYDGTEVAAHDNNTAVHIYRTFTIERGANGTTAATHANSTAMSRYVIPGDVVELTMAEALSMLHQERGGYAQAIGTGEGRRNRVEDGIELLRTQVYASLGRRRVAAV